MKPTPGSQLALFASYSYHDFIADRDGDTLELETDHRRHAEIENALRDLKYGVGLNHLPSGRFAVNAAWLALQVMAHNLDCWAARIGLDEQLVNTKTLRRRFFSLAGRLTRKARRPPGIFLSAGPGKTSSAAPWPDCVPCRSQPDGTPSHRPTQWPRRPGPAQSESVTSRILPIEFRHRPAVRHHLSTGVSTAHCPQPLFGTKGRPAPPLPLIPRTTAIAVSLRWIRV